MECQTCHTPNADGARFCAKCGALLPATTGNEKDPLIGKLVGGRFIIRDVLGEGGMGRVYSAEQQMGTTMRKVAVKTLLTEYARDQKVVERFERECATVVELEHPNTIKFYDYGKTDAGDLYIAMELLSGVSLEKALEGGAIAPDRVDKIVGQVCGSLQEAHEKGIVHRDLKPANIYLTVRLGEEDFVKVLDFGIAKRDEKRATKAEAKLTQAGTVLGTPPYMSPEQFRGQELDKRSDIYSLGVMAYEMLTGRLPFDADTPWAWATQHMTAQPFPFETVPLGSSVPPKMKAAVMRALSKDKNHRQQSVKEFFDEFTMGGAQSSGLTGVPRASAADLAAASAAAQSRAAMGSGQTQIGEPMFAGMPPAGADRTSAPSGSQPVQGGYPSSPGMQVPSYPGAAPVVGAMPTGSGQAYPPPQPEKGGAGPVIGVVAVLGVAAIVGTVFFLKGGKTSGKETVDAGTAATGSSAVKPEEDAGAAEPSATPSATATAPPATTNVGKPPPGPDPHADQECRQSELAAARDQLPDARAHYARCEGPNKPGARMAIEQAEIRDRAKHRPPPPPPPPCRGRHCPR